ncbi:sigma-70 family RNA polymerase sigma factor [Aequorivita sp. F47161]|uniref:Sigma-70 family RNA polymerase sigma factor n=1 Tax=Aequorivita vitellina TaxID=2874475 RepID=A0A9X1QUJ9_9FLAO|nr:sigma-70 family RNA polymerase sigma factor [Aequorivita vitellina]
MALVSLLKGTTNERNRALKFVYGSNRARLVAMVVANNGSEDEAEDIFQETIIAFYENVIRGVFKGDSAIGTYLYSIARFKWLNQIKKDKVRKSHNIADNQKARIQENALTKYIRNERQEKIQEVLALLGESCKNLLIATIYHNQTMREIVANFNYSNEQVARNKKYKCLNTLRKLLETRPALLKILNPHE